MCLVKGTPSSSTYVWYAEPSDMPVQTAGSDPNAGGNGKGSIKNDGRHLEAWNSSASFASTSAIYLRARIAVWEPQRVV